MCLAVPGKVLSIDVDPIGRSGTVDFGGVVREVRLDFVPEVDVGDWVVVHVGFALSRMDTVEAERTLKLMNELAEQS